MSSNALVDKLAGGGTIFGSSVRLPAPELVEILGYAGFDFVCIDGEHGAMGWAEMGPMILAATAAGTVPIVRVLRNEPETVMRVLDLGALGILIPHVRTADDAKRLIDAAKYPPEGQRGVGPGRGTRWGAIPIDAYFRTANRDVVLLGLVEDAEGVENIESIATAGLDVIWVGTADLAASYGVIGQTTHPRVLDATERILAAGLRHGVAVGYPARSADDARSAIARGFRVIGYGTAESYVFQTGRGFLEHARN